MRADLSRVVPPVGLEPLTSVLSPAQGERRNKQQELVINEHRHLQRADCERV